jgi:ribonuclease HI
MYELCFDGLFRSTKGVPQAGFMCIGWAIFEWGSPVAQGYGVTARGMDATSNIAEYLALIDGLQAFADMKPRRKPLRVVGDARVVISQMTGASRVNAKRVKPLFREARRLSERLSPVDWVWVPRRQNKYADRLTRRALRELLADPVEFKSARKAILRDHAARKNQMRHLGGMMVYQPR